MKKASTLLNGFQENVVLSGRTKPVALRFATNGMAFLAEKSGLVFQYDDLLSGRTSPHQVIDLRPLVQDYWDRGLLGLAIHPNFPTVPEIYVLYTHDAFADGTGPRWGDNCPDPPDGPGGTDQGCVVYGRLSRIVVDLATMTGTEVPLISSNWCQQYPSHSIGDMHFGQDGYLYLSAGDGASFTFVDYGQEGLPPNPCGDPPNPLGTGDLDITTSEGGLLACARRTSSRTRIPSGTTAPSCAWISPGPTWRRRPTPRWSARAPPRTTTSSPSACATLSGGTSAPALSTSLWIGDVGDATWEEIDRVPTPTASVSNFGWPCYEGPDERPTFRGNVSWKRDKVYNNSFPA